MPIASPRTTNVGAPRRPVKSRASSRFSSALPFTALARGKAHQDAQLEGRAKRLLERA
jgi:hypothetical protein